MSLRAKIGATLGPACDAPKVLASLLEAGLDVARLNFSHGSAKDHELRVRRLRRAEKRHGRPVTLLADLQGPRFRIGCLEGGRLELVPGRTVEVLCGHTRAPEGVIPVALRGLAESVKRRDRILMDDGKLELVVERVRGKTLRCEVSRGGELTDHKGVNLPGVALAVPTITAKDRADLRTAIEIGADWLAVSFVRKAEDIRLARRLLRKHGADLPIMAKIERPEGVEQLDAILEEADGLLVARGDLGVELPPAHVPILQKKIIDRANAAGKPVMTATQMLDSMRTHTRPTRAEASDVANAVLDGSDCLLLTAETAVGKYPVRAVEMMASIIEEAEASGRRRLPPRLPEGDHSVSLSTCRAGCLAADDLGARQLVVFTQSGFSALQAARFRPAPELLAFTPTPSVSRRLNLVWGLRPYVSKEVDSIEAMIGAVDRALLRHGLARRGEKVVVLSGSPIGVSGTTNLIRVHQVGSLR